MCESKLVSNSVQGVESGGLGVMVNGDTAQISPLHSTLSSKFVIELEL